jgi:hypothetical protein
LCFLQVITQFVHHQQHLMGLGQSSGLLEGQSLPEARRHALRLPNLQLTSNILVNLICIVGLSPSCQQQWAVHCSCQRRPAVGYG